MKSIWKGQIKLGGHCHSHTEIKLPIYFFFYCHLCGCGSFGIYIAKIALRLKCLMAVFLQQRAH